MEFQSEIRDSQKRELLEKAAGRAYRKYMASLTMTRLRGFVNQKVRFEFPVTAIVGPNCGGKTTIVGAAACAYQAIKPRQFFAKSGKLDDSMQQWTIEYEIIDRDLNPKEPIRRTASFRRSKWSRDNLERDVTLFGVTRTVPVNERAEFRKCASQAWKVHADSVEKLGPAVAKAAGSILGRDVSRYSHIKVDRKGRVSLLSAETDGGQKYSEFHFGAGESSIIKMIIKIESMSEHSLVLIEEIENGLHPIATIRMVEYLMDVAARKNIQSIFTTHSDDALLPLPSEAVWTALDRQVIQGKPDIRSLRNLRPNVDAGVAVFCEDDFAKAWLEAVIRFSKCETGAAKCYRMKGDGSAVALTRHHNRDPSIPSLALCFIDGDSRQTESGGECIYRLPGQSPEAFIYGRVHDKLDVKAGQLALGLQRRFEDEQFVKEAVRDVHLTTRDPHLLFSALGRALGFISETIVQGAFLVAWIDAYPDEARAIAARIEEVVAVAKPNKMHPIKSELLKKAEQQRLKGTQEPLFRSPPT